MSAVDDNHDRVAGRQPGASSKAGIRRGAIEPGTIFAGRYQVIGVLQTRARTITYSAHDLTGDRRVTLKILRADFAFREDHLARFASGAVALCGLGHPGIVPLLDYGASDCGVPYMVLEDAQGQYLDQVLKEKGPLPLELAVDITRQICDALAYAHKRGVQHRDLKPKSILIDADAGRLRARISDFGLAKLIDTAGGAMQEVTKAWKWVGTPSYMSPEECLGLVSDQRADIYALGCLVYEIVTGKMAVTGESTYEIMFKQVHAPTPRLNAGKDKHRFLPPGLQDVIDKAMEKDPMKRYQSVEELADDLLYAPQAVIHAAGLHLGSRESRDKVPGMPLRRLRNLGIKFALLAAATAAVVIAEVILLF